MVNTVAVLGSGVMGRAIAIAIARSEIKVTLYSRSTGQQLEDALKREDSLDQRLTGKRQSSIQHIVVTNELERIVDCQIVIESISENLQSKIELLLSVSKFADADAVICSNTSSLDLKVLEHAVHPARKLVGLHFFNPATRLRVVEIMLDAAHNQNALDRLVSLTEHIGYKAVFVPNVPGAVVNRLLFLMIAEAIRLVESGLAPTDLDTTMRLAANHSMGPLELADLIGLDVCKMILENLQSRTGNTSYASPPLLLSMVAEGKLGKKSGEGFYQYGRRKLPNASP